MNSRIEDEFKDTARQRADLSKAFSGVGGARALKALRGFVDYDDCTCCQDSHRMYYEQGRKSVYADIIEILLEGLEDNE